jgi:hypothetical protein
MLGGSANASATATGGNGSVGSNANSFATTINGNAAQALSSVVASSFFAPQGRPRQPHRPILEISRRFSLSPQAPLVGQQRAQSHRPVVSFLFPTRSFPGRVFRLLVDQPLVL